MLNGTCAYSKSLHHLIFSASPDIELNKRSYFLLTWLSEVLFCDLFCVRDSPPRLTITRLNDYYNFNTLKKGRKWHDQ